MRAKPSLHLLLDQLRAAYFTEAEFSVVVFAPIDTASEVR